MFSARRPASTVASLRSAGAHRHRRRRCRRRPPTGGQPSCLCWLAALAHLRFSVSPSLRSAIYTRRGGNDINNGLSSLASLHTHTHNMYSSRGGILFVSRARTHTHGYASGRDFVRVSEQRTKGVDIYKFPRTQTVCKHT